MSVNHLTLMRAAIIEQFRGKPNLDAFIHAIGDQLNDLEELYGQILSNLTLQNAIGTQLDKLGIAMGQGRNALSDSDYRTVIQARIIEYQSNGSVEDMIQLLLTIGGATEVQLFESFPAAFTATVLGMSSPVSDSDVVTAARQTKLSGVGMNLLKADYPVFTFDLNDANHKGFDQGHLAGSF